MPAGDGQGHPLHPTPNARSRGLQGPSEVGASTAEGWRGCPPRILCGETLSCQGELLLHVPTAQAPPGPHSMFRKEPPAAGLGLTVTLVRVFLWGTWQ